MYFASALSILALLPAATLGFTNPFLWNDLADLDIRRVNNTYYYSASTMHYSPGAPILSSTDLVNWQYIGHSVPSLAFGDKYNLANGQRAYVNGIWASFFNYHPTQDKWYWGGCIDFASTYIYSASSVTGPWTQITKLNKCYYDCGMLVDDDGTMYVSYIFNNNIWIAQLSSTGTSEVKSQQVFAPTTAEGYLEGSRLYKRNGLYYVMLTRPSDASEWALMSSSIFGTYTIKEIVHTASPFPSGGNPHQGGLVETQNGAWYYMAFCDAYPGGRIPVLAPLTWGSDNFPVVTLVNNAWGASYSDPTTQHAQPPLTGVDFFTGSTLGPQWEWNHNPDTTKFSVSNGLHLSTATVTSDLYAARNTLTHRILGPTSTATIKLNYASMLDGDRAGLAMLRDNSAWVGVKRDSGAYTVCMVTGINMGTNWVTIATGTTPASVGISGGSIWLRTTASIAPSAAHTAMFSYSTDGATFHSIGPTYALNTTWQFFMGYRFGIFNYATAQLGGSVTVSEFQLDSGSGTTPSAVPGGTTTVQSTTTVKTTTVASTTTTAAGGSSTGVAQQYGQCGGQGWTGPTTCVAPYTCAYSNDFYSQCI
ncbi:glycosyl hydrolase [Mycena sp. CBHHK59/15]|nr:glycosyl hydrolase [Mycena sp. CBHHK59/15]